MVMVMVQLSTASRLPQSRRLRPPTSLLDSRTPKPPQDCRSRGDCGGGNCFLFHQLILSASRLPQSRRLRPTHKQIHITIHNPPQDCRSRGDCGVRVFHMTGITSTPPQDCRSRGDCGFAVSECDGFFPTASRLPQSRRLRRITFMMVRLIMKPPQDCRSRGDCGGVIFFNHDRECFRLKIAAVAATAAMTEDYILDELDAASRLPQSRRLRRPIRNTLRAAYGRLKIAAVAATAAVCCVIEFFLPTSASRLPQSRRLRR